jgi:hypothetical protein
MHPNPTPSTAFSLFYPLYHVSETYASPSCHPFVVIHISKWSFCRRVPNNILRDFLSTGARSVYCRPQHFPGSTKLGSDSHTNIPVVMLYRTRTLHPFQMPVELYVYHQLKLRLPLHFKSGFNFVTKIICVNDFLKNFLKRRYEK